MSTEFVFTIDRDDLSDERLQEYQQQLNVLFGIEGKWDIERSASPSPAPSQEGQSAQDPDVILSGIKQFGLAPDGSDLRDLAAALSRLRTDLDEANYRAEAAEAVKDGQQSAIGMLTRRAEAAEAEVTRLREALADARKMIQTRETLDELGWGKGTSPATGLLAKIDAALSGGSNV